MAKDNKLSWQYDEFKQVGRDYGRKTEAENYDSRHADFRDMEAESMSILTSLEVGRNDVVIDLGSGTGTFAVHAARRCAGVHAVDVSQAMLDYAKSKAVQAGVTNITFHQAGFLTYEHNDPPVDAVVTSFAFHHLPDLWKGIALKRIYGMLKRGGKLYIHDVIVEEADAINNITALIDKLSATGGKLLREDIERHFRDEHSTYDWVIDGLLSRSGFSIREKHIHDGVLGTYICAKQ